MNSLKASWKYLTSAINYKFSGMNLNAEKLHTKTISRLSISDKKEGNEVEDENMDSKNEIRTSSFNFQPLKVDYIQTQNQS